MSDFNNSPKRRRVRFSTEIMVILSTIFCGTITVIYLTRYNDIRNLLQNEETLKERIEDLERENRMLKENLEMLSTPEGIERLARERLGLVIKKLINGGGLVTKSCPTLVTPWMVDCQAPLSMGFSRQEYWNG